MSINYTYKICNNHCMFEAQIPVTFSHGKLPLYSRQPRSKKTCQPSWTFIAFNQTLHIYKVYKVTIKSLTLHTSYTSIFSMTIRTEIKSPNSQTDASWTVNKSCLRPSTQKVIQKDGASSMAKVCIEECYRTCTCANKV